jgi:hypothetical protein
VTVGGYEARLRLDHSLVKGSSSIENGRSLKKGSVFRNDWCTQGVVFTNQLCTGRNIVRDSDSGVHKATNCSAARTAALGPSMDKDSSL